MLKTELLDEKERCMVRKDDPPAGLAVLLLFEEAEVPWESELMPIVKSSDNLSELLPC